MYEGVGFPTAEQFKSRVSPSVRVIIFELCDVDTSSRGLSVCWLREEEIKHTIKVK